MTHIEVNGAELFVRDTGAGEPALVLLHFFAASSRAWDDVVALLCGEYRCVAPDLRGFGSSSAPPSGYAVGDYADDVGALIGRLALGTYVLIGHSMGGKFAMALASRRPPGLAALVLVDPSPPTPEPMPRGEREHLLASHGDRAAMEQMVRRAAVYPLPHDVFETAVDDNLRSSAVAWRAWLTDGSREDIAGEVSNIAVPTLVLRGGDDPIMSRRLLEREVVDRIAGARMVEIPGAGHLLPLGVPAAVAGAIARWARDSTDRRTTTRADPR